MAKARSLKDIELNEVSLVDKAANKKKFLFFKQEDKPAKAGTKKLKKKINIVIDSNGTIGGTKIAVNGDEIKDLRDFHFSFWGGSDSTNPVSCSYSKFVETEDGFSRSETFYLSKGDEVMDEKIKKQLKEYFGEDDKVDFEKAEENSIIAEALETVNEYREDFPDDLKKAVGSIAKQAGLHIPQKVEKKEKVAEEKESVEKAGAKLSKETMKKITDALAALKSILPQLEEKTDKSDNSEVAKSIEELKKSISELEKKKEDDTKDALTKTLTELAKRLETVEKGTGVRKSVDGQEDENKNDAGGKWPSITGAKKS